MTPDLPKDEVLEFKTAFDMFDCDAEGRVEVSEIKEAFINLGFHHQGIFSERILDYMGTLNGGKIDFGEFCRLATDGLNDDFSLDQTNIIFTAFDIKNTGKFNIYDLKDTIRDLGVDIEDEEIEKMFENADSDQDGLVTREDFHRLVTHKTE